MSRNRETTVIRKNSRRSMQWTVSAGVLFVAVAASSAACDEPKVRCTVTSGEAIARYRVKGDVPSTCKGSTLPGTSTADAASYPIAIEGYVPNPSDDNAYQKVNSIAIAPEFITARIVDATQNAGLASYPYAKEEDRPAPPPTGPATDKLPYVFGSFTTVNPDSNNMCAIAAMTVSDLTYPDVPAHKAPNPDDPSGPPNDVDDQPETHIHHEWSNVRVAVSPDSLGTRTFGEVTITQDDCTLSYDVAILFPKVGCDDGKGNADPTLCDPSPNAQNAFGSGISEGIQTDCTNLSTDKSSPDWECTLKYMCANEADCAKYNVQP